MTNRQLAELTASEASEQIRNGDMSAMEYVSALLANAEDRQDLNAFITLQPEVVLEAAEAADRRRAAGAELGPLHGIPIAVKDAVNTALQPTSNGTAALRDFIPKEDADIVRRITEAGALVMGKTNMTELSFGWTSNNGTFGPVRNPHNRDRVPGGSSGGSAAAVAARLTPLAIGADTLGSIRIPASFCGVSGFRPTLNRYPNAGAFALTDGRLDQLGPFARSVRDLELFDAAITAEESAPTPALESIRLGLDEFYFEDLDSRVEKVISQALEGIEKAGVEIVRTGMPDPVHEAFDVAATIMLHESRPSLERFLQEQGTGLTVSEVVEAMADNKRDFFAEHAIGDGRPPAEAHRAMVEVQAQLKATFAAHLTEHNLAAVILPAVAAQPPAIGEEHEADINGTRVSFFSAYGRNTALATAASGPGLVIPAGVDSDGLPVGLELDSASGADRALLSVGVAVEDTLKS